MSNRDILNKILGLLKSGCMDLNNLKNKLNISREELELGLTILETHGYIERTNFREVCRTCMLYSVCRSVCRSPSPNIYKITEKGIKQIKKEIGKTNNE